MRPTDSHHGWLLLIATVLAVAIVAKVGLPLPESLIEPWSAFISDEQSQPTADSELPSAAEPPKELSEDPQGEPLTSQTSDLNDGNIADTTSQATLSTSPAADRITHGPPTVDVKPTATATVSPTPTTSDIHQ